MKTIGFRPDSEIAPIFYERAELLGVSESELARRAIRCGLDRACKEIADEKAKEAAATLKKLRGPNRPFDLPPSRLGVML